MKNHAFTPPLVKWINNMIINELPALIFIADMDTQNIRGCNEAMKKVLGYSFHEMQVMGKDFFKTIMHPEDYPDALKARESFIAGRQKHIAICRFKGKNNQEWRWFYGISQAHDYNEEGNLQTILCTFIELEGGDSTTQAKRALNVILRKSMNNGITKLTNREKYLLPFITRGLQNHEIAEELCNSPFTIETHIKHIEEKLQVHSRAELIRVLKLIGV